MSLTTPVSLLERLRDADFGSPDWTEFVRLYTPIILRWARGLDIQASDAEDLAQDVVVHLTQVLRRFTLDPAKGRFRDWLRTVTRRRWLQFARKRKLLAVDLSEDDVKDPRNSDPARVFEEAEFHAHLVREAMRLLEGRVAETTWKACWETAALDRPVRDVARDLQISEAAVMMAKSRVLKMLREELRGFLD